MALAPDPAMLRLVLLLVVLAGPCTREPAAITNTIAPADPQPAPIANTTLGERPVITTSGSPPPRPRIAPGTETVTITSKGLEVRPQLPRAHTAFHIVNETARSHDLVLRGGDRPSAVSIPPRGVVVLQLTLGDGSYEWRCVSPGHDETALFETYQPGVPLTSS
jgi:hypothetical protein